MRSPRSSIAGLMGAVLVVSLGLAALRSGSEVWAGALFLVTCAVLTLAVVGVACRPGAQRAWWLGFALFGWGYLALAFWDWFPPWPKMPTNALLEVLRPRLGVPLRFKGLGGIDPFTQVGHCLCSLVAATLGGLLARTVFGTPVGRPESSGSEPQRADQATARGWRRPAAIGLAGLVLVSTVAWVGSKTPPGLWTGVIFLLTWSLLGLAVLGAACGRGRRRTIWLGAALFGVGYMILTFSRDQSERNSLRLATDQLLLAVRPWLPPVVREFPAHSDGIAAANARVRKMLDQPVPMRFPQETPLEDVLKFIATATGGADGSGITIYVDPVGLQEAEKTMQSPVQIDLDGVPLSTGLRLALNQLGMGYSIKGGLLEITSGHSDDLSADGDPFLLVGHCLLALLAAGLGGLLAPLAAGPCVQATCRSGTE